MRIITYHKNSVQCKLVHPSSSFFVHQHRRLTFNLHTRKFLQFFAFKESLQFFIIIPQRQTNVERHASHWSLMLLVSQGKEKGNKRMEHVFNAIFRGFRVWDNDVPVSPFFPLLSFFCCFCSWRLNNEIKLGNFASFHPAKRGR